MRLLGTATFVIGTGLLWSVSLAAEGNGRVGIFFDTAGQACSAQIDSGTVTTMYVLAQLDGQTASGITGAEFRLDGIPEGWIALATAPTGAIVIGDVLTDGVSMGFGSCNQGSSGIVTLFTITLVATSTVTNAMVTTRMKEPPSNASHQYPLFITCDGAFTLKKALRGKAFINPLASSDCTDYSAPRAPARIDSLFE